MAIKILAALKAHSKHLIIGGAIVAVVALSIPDEYGNDVWIANNQFGTYSMAIVHDTLTFNPARVGQASLLWIGILIAVAGAVGAVAG